MKKFTFFLLASLIFVGTALAQYTGGNGSGYVMLENTDVLPQVEMDYGDAPDPAYQTLSANDGARHIVDGLTILGYLIDAEADAWQSPDATGDDLDNFADEDGIIFDSGLISGSMASITVIASTPGYLNAWIDFDGNGDWDDGHDQIFLDTPVNAGDNYVNINVPAGLSQTTTFARFRITTYTGVGYFGLATDGEVEDYEVEIQAQAQGGGDGVLIFHKELPGQLGIYLMKSDGTDESQLTDHGWFGQGSPITEKIAFGEYYNDGIWTVGKFGGQEQLTDFGNGPTWSPDASKIAFFDGTVIGADRRIWVMDSDDPSTTTQISNAPGSFPKWSPVDSLILFHGEVGTGIWQIYSDGSGEALLYSGGGWPTWSPDGARIAYTNLLDSCIYIMNADGSDKTKLSTEKGILANWAPDGASIAFEHAVDGGIWTIGVDGANEVQLNADGYAPCWLFSAPSAIISGKEWLALQQNPDGSWGNCCSNYVCTVAKTGLAVLKLESNAIEAGYYPIDDTYVFYQNVRDGLDYLLANAHIINIGPQTNGNPDTDGDSLGVYFVSPSGTCESWHTRETYETSIVAMAIACSTFPDSIVDVVGSAVYGWTYLEVLDDVADYIAWSQTDAGFGRGGWNYIQQDSNDPTGDPYEDSRSDQSNSGYATLGLAYAEADLPWGFGAPLPNAITIPNFVRSELNIWVNNIQDPVDGDANDGGSHYESIGDSWGANMLRTGNLIQQMAWLGDVPTTPRVVAALDYMELHWYDIGDPGWMGPGMSPTAGYQAMYTTMKGLEALGVKYVDWPANTIDWYLDFRNTLVAEQNSNGSWPSSWWDDGEQILSTEWALLTLQAIIVPPPELPDLVVTEKYEVWVDEPYYQVYYQVTNAGNDVAPISIVGLEIDGVFIDTAWVPALLPAGTYNSHFDTLIIHTFGSDTIVVCADYYDDIVELNEANNCNHNTLPCYDFGDAPDDSLVPGYPTLLANNGAFHQILRGYYLGSSIDQEFDGQPTYLADGDDYDGNNDEQGVAFPSGISAGTTTTISVTASAPGYLNAWIDYDINQSWADPTEQIFTDEPLVAGVNMLTFNIPAGTGGTYTFARFRFCSVPGLSFDGPAPDGEVEDYDIEIEESAVSKMHFPQWPDLDTTGVDVYCMGDVLLADDFLCTESGYITDINIWGSWLNDIVPPLAEMPDVKLSIWSDNPSGPNGHSEPLDLLWSRTFIPNDYNMFEYAPVPNGEWFYWPHYGEAVFPGDWKVFELDFLVQEEEAFVQDSGTIYWLSVNAIAKEGTDYLFGWKSSQYHFNDFAVWQTYAPTWNMLCYPEQHPLKDTCMDLAFNISGYPTHSDKFDWGDAPDGPYPTLKSSNGAHHSPDGLTFLGLLIDTENDGIPDFYALGDDLDNIDDEDGVQLTSSLIPGGATTIDIVANGNCLLNGWIDFYNNGNWTDPPDHVFIDVALSPGVNSMSFNVPAGALPGDAYARFRVNGSGGISYDGYGYEGEVEDYKFLIIDTIPNNKSGNPQYPDPNGWDINITYPAELGDDWICSESGPVSDFHFWVSWLDDEIPDEIGNAIEHFTISIYSDIPAGQSQTGYSTPGDMLWTRNFVPNEFSYQPAFDHLQGWFDPYMGFADPINHYGCYRIDIDNFDEPFVQEKGTVYWLVITANLITGGGGANTIVVTLDGVNPNIQPYETWEESGVILSLQDLDGPASYGVDADRIWLYPALLNLDFSMIAGTVVGAEVDIIDYCGTGCTEAILYDGAAVVDQKGNSSSNTNETLYLSNLLGSNVDRLTVTSYEGVVIEIRLIVETEGGGYTLGWKTSLDHWNDNAVYHDLSGGSDWYELYDPISDRNIDMSFIITGQSVQPENLDFGDAPDEPYPTLLANDGARHIYNPDIFLGNLIDTEFDGIQTPDALGDDNDNLDDEDGVELLWPIMAGSPCKIKVSASVNDAYFNGWIDFNGNGSWAEPEDQIFTDNVLMAGDNYITFIAPSDVVSGSTFARFRFSTQPNLSYIGKAEDGEVEDYLVEVEGYGNIKWQQQPDPDLPGLHDIYPTIIADDWLCAGGDVLDIHWWGNYETSQGMEIRGEGISYFHLSIHEDSDCFPIEPEILGFDVPFSSIQEINTGMINAEGSIIYLYEFFLPEPFAQEKGKTYWLDISAFANDPESPPIWRWQEANRWYEPILCGAVEKTDPGSWNTIFWSNPEPGMFTDMAFIITSGTTVEQQTIDLNVGWSGLSSYLVPIKPDVTDIFSPIIGNLEIVYNLSGTYWPSQGVNTLGDWDEYSGYVIKVLADDYLTIYGNEVLNKTVDIAAGWSLVPVLSKTDVDAVNIFAGHPGFYLAKEVAGSGVLWPIFSINSLGNLETGKAYFVYSTSAGSITYLSKGENPSSGGENPRATSGENSVIISPWNDVCKTATTHVVAFTKGALPRLKTGDIIGAFTQSGICAGMVEYSENGFGLVLNGDDVYTTSADGFAPNEIVGYSLYRPSTDQTFYLEVKYDPTLDNSGRFQANGMSAVVQVVMSPTDVVGYTGSNIHIYPNPSEGVFNIDGIPGNAEISIYNAFGKQIYFEETNPPVQIDLSGQPNGIYIIKIVTGSGTYYDKLILD